MEALRDALVLVGAQAIYLWTGATRLALAETTKDSDLAVDRRRLNDEPNLNAAMEAADFKLADQPGIWRNRCEVPVDLLVPGALSDDRGRRGARIPPHPKAAARRVTGLEAAVVDNHSMTIEALDPGDARTVELRVAGPAALLVAKLHKLGERDRGSDPDRLLDKDAHDLYRLLVAIETDRLARDLTRLLADDLAGDVTRTAIGYLEELFAAGPGAVGCQMADRAEGLAGGDDGVTAAAAAALAGDLTRAIS